MASGRLALFLFVATVLTACGTAADSATLSWTAPTRSADGSPITNLAGYTIHYGASAGAMNQTIRLDNPKATTYVVRHLGPGTYYFSITAYTTSGEESGFSELVTKTIR
jgi:hypothetical protein